MGVVLNGRELSDKILSEVALEVQSLKKNGIAPKLCVILVGENPASLSYVNMKYKACERTGIESQILKFSEDMSQSALLDEIERLNNDKSVSGILVQLPLPKHISTEAILEAICPKKDVDGFHPYNVGRLVTQSMSDSSKNSSLGASCGDLANFECSQTTSLVSHSKFAKNTTTSTANTRILDSSTDSSLRESATPTEAIQKNIDCHDLTKSSLAMTSGVDSSLRGSVADEAIHESKMDCHDSTQSVESRNDKNIKNANSSIVSEKSGLCSCERGNKTSGLLTKRTTNLPDLSPQDEFATILAPATPLGIMELLRAYNIEVSGKNVAIIGASNIVGKPLSALMLNAGATISVCHILTKDISVFTKSADIVCVGVGKVNLITADMLKEGVIVVDIGINKVNGKIVGDVDFENVAKKASFITPVPGGVGPMTIAMLLKNTLLCAKILHESRESNAKSTAQKDAQ